MSKSISESFSWLSPDWKVNDTPGDKVVIRGPALFSVEKFFSQGVSRNMKRYVQDEIVRSARTLKNVGIDVNHEISTWEAQKAKGLHVGPKPHLKGNVLFGEEEDGRVEYAGEVNDKEYAQKVRDTDKVRKGVLTEQAYFEKWGKKPLSGVSVDAEYIHLRCQYCQEKFYDPKLFEKHMVEVEHQKNFEWEPHGIVYKRLSLVEPPAEPGVIGAGFEIVETMGASRLLETVMQIGQMQLAERVEKRGNQWCVVHCHGANAGEPIKCFDTEAEANAMHAAIQANQETLEKGGLKMEPKSERSLSGLYEDLKARLPKEDRESWENLLRIFDKYVAEKQSYETFFITGEKNIQESHNAQDRERQEKELALKALEEMNSKYRQSEEEKQGWKTKFENLEDKVHGNFKGKYADVTKSQGTPSWSRNPYDKE